MKRKHFNRLLLIGAVLLSFVIVTGYSGDNPVKVKPNHFQKENTTIDTSEINTTSDGTYHNIPSQVRALTFKEPHTDEKLLKSLFLKPSKGDRVNIRQETSKLGLFK